MLLKRTLTSLVLAVIGIPAIILGGYFWFAIILIFLIGAAWELGHIYGKMDCKVSFPLLIGCTILIVTARSFFPKSVEAVLAISVLAVMTWHLVDYERGRQRAATDFASTLASILYLGWIGSYFIDLRNLPNGLWWLLIVLPTIWLADMAAYFVGIRFGRHPLSPRLSPKKTWEGYCAGVLFGTLSSIGLAYLWHAVGGLAFIWWKVALLGLMLSVLTTLGDLGESMFKRQAGVKDSSNFFPGHGGFLDRIDSWLWGAALGYFFIVWFLI